VKKTEPPSQEEFDALLAWLDPDRERAGAILYEEIRCKLIKILVRRQCYAAEELWDETTNRVSHRVQDIANTYVGDPALYFYGVAKKVYQEWLKWLKDQRMRLDAKPPPPPEPDEDVERMHDCLEKCRQELDPEEGELILKYYEKEKRAKIEHRKELADGLGITLNSLRMRVHRINAILQKCIVDCLKPSEAT
jgi:DNA-directed RNA polymerase specialized sigma24 family protein